MQYLILEQIKKNGRSPLACLEVICFFKGGEVLSFLVLIDSKYPTFSSGAFLIFLTLWAKADLKNLVAFKPPVPRAIIMCTQE